MSIWHDCIKPILITIIVFILFIGIVNFFAEQQHSKEFNNGYCQTCGKEVIPIGHMFDTDYYCQNCHKYNN